MKITLYFLVRSYSSNIIWDLEQQMKVITPGKGKQTTLQNHCIK